MGCVNIKQVQSVAEGRAVVAAGQQALLIYSLTGSLRATYRGRKLKGRKACAKVFGDYDTLKKILEITGIPNHLKKGRKLRIHKLGDCYEAVFYGWDLDKILDLMEEMEDDKRR